MRAKRWNMRLDKLTVKTQEAIAAAQHEASELGHAQIAPLHLLDALLHQDGGLAVPLLEKIGIPEQRIVSIVKSELGRIPTQSQQAGMAMDPMLNQVLNKADKEARDLKDEYISIEHLLLAL
ncbi:MAG: type VI secretion system ATPase TssH, partial [Planctomycetaceae bacterium]